MYLPIEKLDWDIERLDVVHGDGSYELTWRIGGSIRRIGEDDGWFFAQWDDGDISYVNKRNILLCTIKYRKPK